MSAPEQGVWGWVHDEDCRIQTDDHSEACARRSATLMAFIQRHRDAALAAARAESDALRAALERTSRHWHDRRHRNGSLEWGQCPWYPCVEARAALAPSPAEPAAPERDRRYYPYTMEHDPECLDCDAFILDHRAAPEREP